LRIFILSVLGVQSSATSTLLNVMFGARFRTRVSRCTQGINMQLIQVENRQHYDYILLLDTEGVRGHITQRLPGSQKRDNHIATLTVLLSDATIVGGEHDSDMKDITPII
jgi:hypothetical protein